MLVSGNLRKADVPLGCLGKQGWKPARMWAGLLVGDDPQHPPIRDVHTQGQVGINMPSQGHFP